MEIAREGRGDAMNVISSTIKIPKDRLGALGVYRYTYSPDTGGYFASRLGIKQISRGEVVEITPPL